MKLYYSSGVYNYYPLVGKLRIQALKTYRSSIDPINIQIAVMHTHIPITNIFAAVKYCGSHVHRMALYSSDARGTVSVCVTF